MNSAVQTYADKLVNNDLDASKTNILRIRATKSFAGYPNNMTDDAFLDRIYTNLDLTGNETLFETFQKLEIYRKFIDFMDLSDEDYLTMKIGRAVSDDPFSCKILMLKYICKKVFKFVHPMV